MSAPEVVNAKKKTLREQWDEFKQSSPGQRFQDRYERHQQSAHRRTLGWRIAVWALGLILLAIGAFFAVFPGPGIPFLFFGGGLLATESRWLAKVMDWFEVRTRAVVSWLHRRWRKLHVSGKALVVLGCVLASAASAYAGWHYFLGHGS